MNEETKWQPIATCRTYTRVLLWNGAAMCIGSLNDKREVTPIMTMFGATHWAPLPLPPKESL